MRKVAFCRQTLLGLALLSLYGCGSIWDIDGRGASGGNSGAGGVGAGQGGSCVEGSPCDDGNACTLDDVCSGGVCTGQNAVKCVASDICSAAECNPETGACETSPSHNGAICGENGACESGSCIAAKLRVDVFDSEGLPIQNAKLIYKGSTYNVDAAGFVEIDATESHLVARLEAPYYAPSSVVADVPPGTHVGVVSRLLPSGAPLPIDMTKGGVAATDKVRVTLSPGSVVDSAGMPVNGLIGVTVTPLDPTGPDLTATPGPLTGKTADGRTVLMLSNFMAEVGLWRGSEPLQLAPGATATLEMVLPDALQSTVNVGDTIPAWYYDLGAGLWREEGSGVIVNATAAPGKLAWQAQVKHFTWWNIDWEFADLTAGIVPNTLDCLTVEVVDNATMLPINGAQVRATATTVNIAQWGIPSGSFVDDVFSGATANGKACVNVLRPRTVGAPEVNSQVAVSAPGYTISSVSVIPGPPPAGFSVDTNAKPLVVTTNTSGTPDTCFTQTSCLALRVYMRPLSCVKGTITAPFGSGGATGTTVYSTYGDWASAAEGPVSTSSYVSGNTYCLSAPIGQTINLLATKTNSNGATYRQNSQVTIPMNMNGSCDAPNSCATADIALAPAQGLVLGGNAWGSNKLQVVEDIAVNANGDTAIAGYFEESAQFGNLPAFSVQSPADKDAFLVRVNVDGTIAWAKQFGGIGDQVATGVDFDSLGNIVVAGHFYSGIAIDQTTYTSAGAADGFVAKFSPTGSYQWSKAFGGVGNQFPENVVVDRTNKMPADALYRDNILVVGEFDGILGNMCGSCATDKVSCYIPCGNGGALDAFALKYYATGDPLLGATIGGPGNQRALSASIAGNGDTYVVGDYEQNVVVAGIMPLPAAGGVDPFIAKSTSLGTFLWAKSMGVGGADAAQQSAVAVAAATNGDVYVAGNFNGNMLTNCGNAPLTSNGDDLFVVKYDASGTCSWGNRFGLDPLGQFATDIDLLADGNLLIAGSVKGSIQFNGAPSPPIGSVDAFIAKLHSVNNGAPIWNKRWSSATGWAYGPHLGVFPGGLRFAGVFGGTGSFTFENTTLMPTQDGQPDVAFLRLVP